MHHYTRFPRTTDIGCAAGSNAEEKGAKDAAEVVGLGTKQSIVKSSTKFRREVDCDLNTWVRYVSRDPPIHF
jgi:hypothetical protein